LKKVFPLSYNFIFLQPDWKKKLTFAVREAGVSRSANVERNGGQKWVKWVPHDARRDANLSDSCSSALGCFSMSCLTQSIFLCSHVFIYVQVFTSSQPHFFTLWISLNEISTKFCFLDILTKPKACIAHSSAILT